MGYKVKGNANRGQEQMELLNKITYHPNLEENSNILSRLTFFYTNTIIKKGVSLKKNDQYITDNDLYEVQERFKPYVQQQLIKQFNKNNKDLPIDKKTGSQEIIKIVLLYGSVAPIMSPTIIQLCFDNQTKSTLATLGNVLQVSGPIFLKKILEFLEDKTAEQHEGYIWASGIFICYFTKIWLTQNSFEIVNGYSMKIQNGISGILLEKIFKLSSASKKYFDAGSIMNFITVDQAMVFNMAQVSAILISSPFMIVLGLFLICLELGWYGMLTPIFFLFSFRLQGKLQQSYGKIRRDIMFYKDKKAKAITEYIQGIRIVKYYAWEEIVEKTIQGIRKQESEQLIKGARVRSVVEEISNFMPILISITIFSIYVAAGNDLKPSQAYSLLALFNFIVLPFRILVFALMAYIGASTAVNRMNHFLDAEEIKEDNVIEDTQNLQKGQILIENGQFAWENVSTLQHNILTQPKKQVQKKSKKEKIQLDQEAQNKEKELDPVEQLKQKDLTILKNINFQAQSGELVAIIGLVAAGKSSFLHALLGEMEKIQGSIKKNGSIAYVSQQAWLQNDSLKNNILFGSQYQEERYKMVIDKCCLQADLDILPGKDETEIGERGINLSGGQKQRISLARAVYADADIYLIDDCLSALDAHVGKSIFENVIKTILKEKTIVFVTHALNYMPQVSRIVVFSKGQIQEQGTYEELSSDPKSHFQTLQVQLNLKLKQEKSQENNNEVAKTLNTRNSEENINLKNDNFDEDDDNENIQDQDLLNPQKNKNPRLKFSLNQGEEEQNIEEKEEKQEEILKKQKKDGALVQKEERAVGSVPLRVYLNYISSGGCFTTTMVILTLLLAQIGRLAIDWFIGQWGNDKFDLTTGESVLIYAGIGLVCAFLFYFRGLTFVYFTIQSADNFQRQLIQKLLHTPMYWFDITPTGRIISRTTKDQDDIDTLLPFSLLICSQQLLLLFSTIILIAVILPFTLIVAVISTLIFVKIISWYLISAREIKRLETNGRAPVISNFQESINGTYIIRAFKKEEFFIQKYLNYQHRFLVGLSNYNYTQRWISVMSDLFGICIIASTCYFAVASKNSDYISDPALMGLAIAQSFQIILILSFTLKMIADSESQMNSLVRMLQYINENPQEDDWYTQPVLESEIGSQLQRNSKKESQIITNDIMKNNSSMVIQTTQKWPKKGNFDIKEVTFRYRPELPTVIHGISLNIQPNEKIGIVGRTGSGKSTMTLGLLRILEIASGGDGSLGCINLDNQDISKVGLHILREKVTIIPQDPVLFTGTLKFNVDPFDKYSREKLINSLKKVQIWDQVKEMIQKQKIKSVQSMKKGGQDEYQTITLQDQQNNIKQETQQQQTNIIDTQQQQVQEEDILNLKIDEGGDNFSLGQRQLICMARALIREPKVLLLDEATASIDEKTDHLIQQMIKKAFKQTTVITIAHRINTIMQYDKVVVLDQGRIVELDTPLNLLKNNDGKGQFASLVNEGGSQFREKMIQMAQNKDINDDEEEN